MSSPECNSAPTPHDLAWHERRRLGIGGSDVAALFGVSPYASPYSLWLEKTGQLPMDESEEPVWIMVGRELEPLTRKLYTKLTGREVDEIHRYVIDKEHPYMRCELDGTQTGSEVHEGRGIFEGKTTNVFRHEEWDENATPLWYECQLQHAFSITGHQWGTIGCLVLGSSEPLIYRDHVRNDRFIEAMRKKISHFWNYNVLGKNAPEIDGHRATCAAIKALHPDDSGAVQVLSEELADTWYELGEIRNQKKALDTQITAIRNTIKVALGDASYGVFQDGRGVSYRTQERSESIVRGSKFRSLHAASARSVGMAIQNAPDHQRRREDNIITTALRSSQGTHVTNPTGSTVSET